MSIASRSPSTERSTRSARSITRPSQLRGDLLGVEQHTRVLRAARAGDEVLAVVADDKQRAAGSDRGGSPAVHDAALVDRDLEVHDHDEVERARFRQPLAHVGLNPLDLDAAFGREPAGVFERDLREVDAGHRPTAFSEPDCVPAGAAGEVERPPRSEAIDLGDEKTVGFDPEQWPCLAVPAVPVVALHPSYSHAS